MLSTPVYENKETETKTKLNVKINHLCVADVTSCLDGIWVVIGLLTLFECWNVGNTMPVSNRTKAIKCALLAR